MPAYLSEEWVAELDGLLQTGPAPADIPADTPRLVVQYEVTGAPGGDRRWYVELDSDGARAISGLAPAAHVTFSQGWPVAVAIQLGQRAVPEALLCGDVRVGGDPTTLLPWRGALHRLDAAVAELSARTEIAEKTEMSARTEIAEKIEIAESDLEQQD